MALATDFDVYSALAIVLRDVNVAAAGLPTKKLIFRYSGAPMPNMKGVEEWADWKLLSARDMPTRTYIDKRVLILQLMLYSLHAHLRIDTKGAREYELAAIYKPYLNKVRYNVNSTCIVVKETKIDYLDLRALGDFAAPAKQRSPETDISSAVIIVEAEINENKGI